MTACALSYPPHLMKELYGLYIFTQSNLQQFPFIIKVLISSIVNVNIRILITQIRVILYDPKVLKFVFGLTTLFVTLFDLLYYHILAKEICSLFSCSRLFDLLFLVCRFYLLFQVSYCRLWSFCKIGVSRQFCWFGHCCFFLTGCLICQLARLWQLALIGCLARLCCLAFVYWCFLLHLEQHGCSLCSMSLLEIIVFVVLPAGKKVIVWFALL